MKRNLKESVLSLPFLLLCAVSIGVMVVTIINKEQWQQLDHYGINSVQQYVVGNLTSFVVSFTFLGSKLFLTIMVVLVTLLLFVKKRRGSALFLLMTSALGGLLNTLLKLYFQRERPTIYPVIVEQGFSFPSGHSMGSFIVYASIAYVLVGFIVSIWLKRLIVLTSVLLVLSIGISRIYLGVHYPTDVLAGFFFGSIWFMLCIIIANKVTTKQRHHNKEKYE